MIEQLPLDYYAPGPGWLFCRNKWSDDSTVVLLQLGICESPGHGHRDPGSFQVFRNGWLSKEATGYRDDPSTGTGVFMPDHHNCLLIDGKGPVDASKAVGQPNVLRLQSHADFAYAAVDLTPAYRVRPEEISEAHPDNPEAVKVQREFVFIRALETLVILDRIETLSPTTERKWLLHGRESLEVQSKLRVRSLLPVDAVQSAVVVNPELDTNSPYRGWRLEVVDSSGVFLSVLQCREPGAADLAIDFWQSSDWFYLELSGVAVSFAKRDDIAGNYGGTPFRQDVQPMVADQTGVRWS